VVKINLNFFFFFGETFGLVGFGHVVSNIVFTGLGNQVPFADVVSFHGQMPTEAGNARNVLVGSARMRFKKVDLVRNSLGCCYQSGKEEEH